MMTTHSPRARGGRGATVPVLELSEVRELSAQAARYLGTVVHDKNIASKNRISASRALMTHHQWRETFELEVNARTPEAILAAALGGDRTQAIAWLKSTLAKLESAEATSRALIGGGDVGPSESSE